MIKDPEAYDYLNWLCKITGCISVWDRFYYGKANDRQIEALKKLSQRSIVKLVVLFIKVAMKPQDKLRKLTKTLYLKIIGITY